MPINNITQTVSTIPAPPHRGIDVQTVFVNKQEDFQDHLTDTTITELNTLKDQLNTRIGEINSTVTTMNSYADTASAGASTATTKAGEASTSASEALTYKNQAETFKNNASTSATKASQWADNNYNVEVETGKYSAKHWSTVAQNATANKIDKVASTDNAVVRFDGTTGNLQNSGVIIDDNGNVGIGDSAPQYKLSIKQSISLPSTAGSKITAFSKYTNVGSNASFLRFDTVRTSAGSSHESSEERIRKVVDAVEMGYIGFGDNNVKLGNSYGDKVIIDINGNVLVTSPAGLGYGAGAGGTVTQLTSKSTAVTLNKPSGAIITSNSTLGGGESVIFMLYNNLCLTGDVCVIASSNGNYNVISIVENGQIHIRLTSIAPFSLSDIFTIRYALIKGAIA